MAREIALACLRRETLVAPWTMLDAKSETGWNECAPARLEHREAVLSAMWVVPDKKIVTRHIAIHVAAAIAGAIGHWAFTLDMKDGGAQSRMHRKRREIIPGPWAVPQMNSEGISARFSWRTIVHDENPRPKRPALNDGRAKALKCF